MPPRVPKLPEHFDLDAFMRIASLRSSDPEVFARRNRHGPVAGPTFYKKFGESPHCACLIQRNSPILMVAHVDTVTDPMRKAHIDGGRLYHNAMDNRLGVYLGLEVLPAMGLHTDLLLTTDEEHGHSTASLANTRKQYSWIFSFDRKGDDVVCYQYDNPYLTEILEGAGFAVGEGSYSCIAELEHLGCCGVNFGNGMADYHSDQAYCDLAQLNRQLKRFTDFYAKYADLWFPHRPSAGVRNRADIHTLAVPAESLLWQYEFHLKREADNAAFRDRADLGLLLRIAPELRQEFAEELANRPELAADPVEVAAAAKK